jgi:glucose/mannose-6-phosphate isomerase
MNLDDVRAIERIDAHNTRAILTDFPAQCRRGRALPPGSPPATGRPRLVVIAGMGGSASGGDVVAACAAATLDVPILVHKCYGLPAAATGRETLVIAVSYSGETVEVLSAAEMALARGVPLVAVTAGGALGALADQRALPRVTLPSGLMPRMALGYLVFPLLSVLAGCGAPVASAAQIDDALDVLKAQASELGPASAVDKNPAKRLALELGDRLPAVYGGPLTATAAYRWKTDLEENAKVLAIAGAVPEMNHNEIEAWRGPGAAGRHALILREDSEPPEIARRFTLLRELLSPDAGGVSEVWARGRGRLARLLSLVALGQWVSYYVAMLQGTDPWPVPVLTEVKRRLSAPLERRPRP